MEGIVPLIISIIIAIIFAWIWGKIFSKAGFNAWLGILMLIPIANLIMFLYFAFAEWPIHRQGQGG